MSKIRPISEVPDNTYEVYALPLDEIPPFQQRSALYQDHKSHDAIKYRPLQKVSDSVWMISVNGRVYTAEEDVLEAGIEAFNSHSTP